MKKIDYAIYVVITIIVAICSIAGGYYWRLKQITPPPKVIFREVPIDIAEVESADCEAERQLMKALMEKLKLYEQMEDLRFRIDETKNYLKQYE